VVRLDVDDDVFVVMEVEGEVEGIVVVDNTIVEEDNGGVVTEPCDGCDGDDRKVVDDMLLAMINKEWNIILYYYVCFHFCCLKLVLSQNN